MKFKNKILSVFLLMCLLVTAMPTAFMAEDTVTKGLEVVFHSAMDAEKNALEGVEYQVAFTDGKIDVSDPLDSSANNANYYEITHNGENFIYEYQETPEGEEEPVTYTEEYPYLRVVTTKIPDGYDKSTIDNLYSVDEFIDMTANVSVITQYYPIDVFEEKFVASDEETYEIYREYYNEKYGNTSIYYGNEDGFNSAELIAALNCLTEVDTCLNVYVTVFGDGFPTISAEVMTILNARDAWLGIENDDTWESVYWYPVSSNSAFELAVAENTSVTAGLDVAKIPYVLLSVKGMEGAEEAGFYYAIDGGILADGIYREENGDYTDSKYLYYYDATNKIFKLCDGEAEYFCYKDNETQEYYYSEIFYEGTLPVSGYYVIVDEALPASLTEGTTIHPGIPVVPPTTEDESVEIQKVDVKWSATNPWYVEVEDIATADMEVEYFVDILKDGEYVANTGLWEQADGKVVFDVSYYIALEGSGKYTAEVYARDMEKWNQVGYGVSDVCVYEKPAEKLATPGNIKFDLQTNKLTFDAVKDAVAYDVWIFETYGGERTWEFRFERIDSDDIDNITVDMISDEIEWIKEECQGVDMELYVGVCAVSENMNKVAYSDYAELLVYEQKQTAKQVKENFEKAFENVEEEPYEAFGVLRGVSNDTIIEMLETDSEFAKKVEKLDTVFVEMLGDFYKGATSKTDMIDASKVKVVGVAMNAINGMFTESVELSFAKPEKEATVPKGYKNGLQLDISLLVDGEALENLAVPVTITMPIPEGVDTKDLVILHYHGDATEPVVIVPTINEDGTMTFIVDGFSTFVIANQAVEPDASSPKTGDTSTTIMICSLILLAAGVVLVSKRNSFVK